MLPSAAACSMPAQLTTVPTAPLGFPCFCLRFLRRCRPHQYRFYVPHDPQGLATLYAQSGLNMCDVLQAEQLLPGAFHIGGYGDVIHEAR